TLFRSIFYIFNFTFYILSSLHHSIFLVHYSTSSGTFAFSTSMAYKNLQQFIDVLEREGELVRIKEYVNPKLEISEITDRISKTAGGGKALLFENTGYDFPVLMNAYGSEKRMCLALGVQHLDDVAKEIESLFHLLASPKESIIDKLKLLPKLSQFA